MMIPFVSSYARRWLAGLLLLAVLPVAYLRERPPVPDPADRIAIKPVALPSAAQAAPHLGVFRLEGIWQITSRNPMFGGYSTLQRLRDGQFETISDRGYALRFSPPGQVPATAHFIDFIQNTRRGKLNRDAEASAYDPVSGRIWIGWEGSNSISRHNAMDLYREARSAPEAMQDWSDNSGPEAMVRLSDGRFLVLAEGFTDRYEIREHAAVLFSGDPTEKSTGKPIRLRLSGPARFSPTDAAQMPDGRVLILMRRAVWPLPFRFAGRIAVADPAKIRANGTWQAKNVAYLSSSLPIDNFEGIVAEPGPDGRVIVWLISDDNSADTQRTLLWKMSVDPAQL